MIEEQRGIGMLSLVQEVHAIDGGLGTLARKRQVPLIAAEAAAGACHVEAGETCLGADRTDGRRDVACIRAIGHQPHMLQLGVIAEPNNDGVVRLIRFGAVGGDKALHERRVRRLTELEERAGIGGSR